MRATLYGIRNCVREGPSKPETIVNRHFMTLMAIAVLAATGTSPSIAHEAPRLVEYFPSTKHAPTSAGDTASARSAVGSATLEVIHDDPSAVDVRVGKSFPDAVRSARALSLELPGSNGAGPESIASFGNLEIEQRTAHDYSVYGRSESPASEVSLVVLGQDVVGTITYESEVYEVRPLGGGLTAVYRRDTSQWPDSECGVTGLPFQASFRERRRESGTATDATEQKPSQPDTVASPTVADSGEEIDVLVAYTPRARSAAGNIDALIRLFLDDTNRFFSSSGIRTRVRLVHSYRTEYTQTTQLSTDIDRLEARDDGYMDEVHARRNQYGADLVALLVARRSDYSGIANLYHGGGGSQAFSVTAQNRSSTTFAHELGHNLGAHHDPDTDTNEGFPYGHGLCNSRDNWRTIMSYNFRQRCRPGAPYFSNPDIRYRGTRTGDEQTRNNARVINETAQHVARYRKALPPPHSIPLVMSADSSTQQGFLRVVNRSSRDGTVRIDAFDDDGRRFGPVYLSMDAKQTRHFNSTDLENGDPSKGLSRGIGSGRGDWRLHLSTTLDIKPRAYVRTTDGFLTSIHEVAGEEVVGSMRYRVPTFNPGRNWDQQSRLRLINVGDGAATIEISALDDRGQPPSGGSVRLTLPAGAAHTLTAEELEQGDRDISGRFGTGSGKWQLSVSADQPLDVMSLLFSRTGNLTNLSR